MATTTATKSGAKVRKKKAVKNVPRGNAYIQASYNNTIISVTDLDGNVLAWGSAGMVGFKGPKKATPYAAGIIVKKIADELQPYGVQEVYVFVKGIGQGREGAIRAFNTNNINVIGIKDVTPIPHNGCRARKRRRV